MSLSAISGLDNHPEARCWVQQSSNAVLVSAGYELTIFLSRDQAADLAAKLAAHLEAVQYVPPVPAIPEAEETGEAVLSIDSASVQQRPHLDDDPF